MIIRVATLADIPMLVELEKLCNPSSWSETQLSGAIKSSSPSWIIENEQHYVLAMLVWQLIVDQAEIHLLNTHPQHRRQGYAQYLLRHLFQYAQHQGLTRILLEVRAGNNAARQLYLSEGFTDCGQRKNYYTNGEHAILMEKIC